jgi:hypothetical protein
MTWLDQIRKGILPGKDQDGHIQVQQPRPVQTTSTELVATTNASQGHENQSYESSLSKNKKRGVSISTALQNGSDPE